MLLPDGMNLNQELVKQGWCWWYRRYAPGDMVLGGLENEAREGQKGLWADPQPVPPWGWRKQRFSSDSQFRRLSYLNGLGVLVLLERAHVVAILLEIRAPSGPAVPRSCSFANKVSRYCMPRAISQAVTALSLM